MPVPARAGKNVSRERPKVLFVMADQLAASARGAYGNSVVQAPTIDRLAEDGVVFENAYCNVPLCAPSRASLLAGRLAARVGVFDNGAELAASVPTIRTSSSTSATIPTSS
jgi:choline-sulfatase